MTQRRSSGESRRGSSSSSRQQGQPSESRQMGQSGSGTGRRQQGTMHPPRQSGTGTTSVKRQQSAQDVERADEAETGRHTSNRRRDEVQSDEDIERAGLTRESGIDDESDSR